METVQTALFATVDVQQNDSLTNDFLRRLLINGSMKTNTILIISLLLFACPAPSQDKPIYLLNPSFEGMPAAGTLNSPMLFGWQNCGQEGETPPDVHAKPKNGNSLFGVTQEPFHGNTFLGMVVRDNNTWESISQKLEHPLQPGKCYELSIYLCRSKQYQSLSRLTNNPMNLATPATLRLWAGRQPCAREEILASSPLITNTHWVKYRFEFEVHDVYSCLTFEAFYETPDDLYNGNLLLDNISPLMVIESCAPLRRFEFSDTLMGTEWRILLFAKKDSLARAAAGTAFWRVKTIEQSMSDYLEDSEVSRLSATAGSKKWVKVSGDLWQVLSYGQAVAQKTKGAFDLSAGAFTKLWRKAFRQKEFPSKEEIEAARRTVDYRKIRLRQKDRSVRLDLPGTRLDLGALAKGYAADEAMKSLWQQGIQVALVDGGGDILAGSPPPGETGWLIGFTILEKGEPVAQPVRIASRAVATSGATYRYLQWEGKRYSHIIDPRTGLGLTNRCLATVTASSCMEADAWATAVSVSFNEELKDWLLARKIAVSFFEE